MAVKKSQHDDSLLIVLDELAGRIHVVARVYACFLTIKSSHIGNVRIDVNIGYERCRTCRFRSLRT